MLKSVKKLKFEIILTISIYVLAIILGAFIQIDTNKIEIPENTPTALAILKNNLKASIMLLFGLITLGITTCISLIINGTILGNVIMVNLKYLSGTEVLSRILPHGILEIPATILLAAVGFQTLKVVINLIRQKKMSLKDEIKNGLIVTFLGLALMIIGAFIEGYITTMFI